MNTEEIMEKTTEAIDQATEDSDGGVVKTLIAAGVGVIVGIVIDEIRHRGLPLIGKKSKKRDKFDEEFGDNDEEETDEKK